MRELKRLISPEIDEAIFTFSPFVLVDEMPSWRSWNKWNINFFKEQYGDQSIMIKNMVTSKKKEISMKYFLTDQTNNDRFYLNWQFTFNCPELLDDYPKLDAFKSWMEYIPPVIRRSLKWIYIGGEGTGSALHTDVWGTSAWNALFQGEKEWIIIKPENGLLLNREINLFDCSLPQLKEMGCKDIYSHLQVPGEIMYIPSLWWHQVRNLSDTVALTENFVNTSNINYFVEEAEKSKDKERILIANVFKNKKWKARHL